MPKFLIQGSYSPDGTKGLIKGGGSSRRQAAADVAKALGGSLDAFYFAFGKSDALVILDLPDSTSAAAISLALNSTGLVTGRTTVLLTPEEMDAAAKKVPPYRKPGK